MSITTKQRLARADKRMISVVREHLNYHMIGVRKWMPYRGRRSSRDVVYEAFIDVEQVSIPIPVDRYSFYVCMHEIGHIVKGERSYGYQQEYVAEQYAIAKCIKYGYLTKEIEESAKRYVYEHLVQDLVIRNLPIDRVSDVVVAWTGRTKEQARKRALRLAKMLYKQSDSVPEALQRLSAQRLNVDVYRSILEVSIKQLKK
jgi:hypothetical protein